MSSDTEKLRVLIAADQQKIAMLRGALGCLLGDVDYRNGACSLTEQVGACINPQTLKVCDEAMAATKPQAMRQCEHCNGRTVYLSKDVATGQEVEVSCLFCNETGKVPA